MNLDEKATDFALKEYESLKMEATNAIAESRILERNAVIGSIAIWAWATNITLTVSQTWLIGSLPIVLCALGALRSYALYIRLERISEYLIKVEERVAEGYAIGWERSLIAKSSILTSTSIVFWIATIIANLFAAAKLFPDL